MYHDYRLEDILQELRDEKADVMAKIEAWRKVEIARKKDGSEFQSINRALRNAHLEVQYGLSNDLVVGYHTAKGGYQTDYVRGYVWLNDLPNDDPRVKQYGNSNLSYVCKTAEELRKTVAEHIDYLTEYAAGLDFDLMDAEDAYTKWIERMTEAEKELKSTVSRHLFGKISYATHFSWS